MTFQENFYSLLNAGYIKKQLYFKILKFIIFGKNKILFIFIYLKNQKLISSLFKHCFKIFITLDKVSFKIQLFIQNFNILNYFDSHSFSYKK